MQQFISTAQQSFQMFSFTQPGGATAEQQAQQQMQQMLLSSMMDRVQQEVKDPRPLTGPAGNASGEAAGVLGPVSAGGAAAMAAHQLLRRDVAQSQRHMQAGSSSDPIARRGAAGVAPGVKAPRHHYHHHHHHHH